MSSSSLCRCPNEILAHIFSFVRLDVNDVDPTHKNEPEGGLWALSLTSRRFQQIALPILAHTVWAETPTWPSLCRFFLSRPHLRLKVKQVRLEQGFDDWYLPWRNHTEKLNAYERKALVRVARQSGGFAKYAVPGMIAEEMKAPFFTLLFHWFPNLDLLSFYPGLDDSEPMPLTELLISPRLGNMSHLREVNIGPPVSFINTKERMETGANHIQNLLRIPTLRILRLNSPVITNQESRPNTTAFVNMEQKRSNVNELYLTNAICSSDGGDEGLLDIFEACIELHVVLVDECIPDITWGNRPWADDHTFNTYPFVGLIELHHQHLEELWLGCERETWDTMLEEMPMWKCSALRSLYLSHRNVSCHARRFPNIEILPPLLERLKLERRIGSEEQYFKALKMPKPPRYKTPRIQMPWNESDHDVAIPWPDEEKEDSDEEEQTGDNDEIWDGFDEFNDLTVSGESASDSSGLNEEEESEEELDSDESDEGEGGW